MLWLLYSVDDSKEADEIPARKKLLRNEENVDKVYKYKVIEYAQVALSQSPSVLSIRKMNDGMQGIAHSKDFVCAVVQK